MPHHTSAEVIKRLVMDYELPRREKTLFGVMCPYCGKSDRIRVLEPPGDLEADLPENNRNVYTAAWADLAGPDGSLGICRFCVNILKLSGNSSIAVPIDA